MPSPADLTPVGNQPSGEALWALEATTDCVILLDRDLRITYVNNNAAELNGMRPEAIVGRLHREVWPQTLGTPVEDRYREAMATQCVVTFEQWYDEDGGGVWHEIHAHPTKDGVAVFYRNITAKKERAEQEYADRERLDAVVRATDLGVWYCELPFADTPLQWSRQVRRHFGIPDDRVVRITEFFDYLHPEDREPTGKAIEHAIEAHEPYDVVYRTQGPDGKLRHIRAIGNAFYRPDGTPYRFDGLTVDLTERVERERELDERVKERTRELTEANKEMEGFTYTVAHDLRAPLRSIVATSRILLEETAERLNEEERNLLSRQVHSSNKLATLIDDLLKLSRLAREPLTKSGINLTRIAEDIREDILARRKDDLKIEVQPDLKAFGDPRLVRILLENLMENAAKFSPNGGTIRVGERKPGEFFVSDEGIGFDMQYIGKVFRPFERLVTESQFPGTGVGLANVQRIARRHGGDVGAESEPGKGSTFWFTLG